MPREFITDIYRGVCAKGYHSEFSFASYQSKKSYIEVKLNNCISPKENVIQSIVTVFNVHGTAHR
jgi:hypothetical protein